MLKRIYMNRMIIARNKKAGIFAPAICVRTSQGTERGHTVFIEGRSVVRQMQEPEPLAAGATVWIETLARVSIITHKEHEDDDYINIS